MPIACSPAYDSTTESTWVTGLGKTTGGAYQGVGGTAAALRTWAQRMFFAPGLYKLNKLTVCLALASDTYCDGTWFGILRDAGSGPSSIVTLGDGVTTWLDVDSDRANSDSYLLTDFDLGDIELTIEDGYRYFYAFAISKIAGAPAGYPGIRTLAIGQDTGIPFFTESSSELLTAIGTTSTVTHPEMSLTVKTKVRKVFAPGAYAGSTQYYYLPRRTDGPYFIKFENSVVADGEAFTATFNYDNAGTLTARTTLVQDLGATDQIAFGGASVALAAAGAEAGDTFDLGVVVNPDTPSMNLFYLNKTTGQGPQGAGDLATFSHAGKNDAAADGSRDQVYSIDDPETLVLSGTAAVAAVEAGYESLCILGDSQARVSGKLYRIKDQFTYPRIWWDAGISGNRLTETASGFHTAAYLRYKSVLVGEGDLCEMVGMIFVSTLGVNDVSTVVSNTEANRNKCALRIAQRLAWILEDIDAHGNEALLIGLPPYSNGDATEPEAKCIQYQINSVLEGLAIAMRCAYFNPWYHTLGSSQSEDVPVFSTQFSDDGLHYTEEGGVDLIGQWLAQEYESGQTGTRKKRVYPGLLMPI